MNNKVLFAVAGVGVLVLVGIIGLVVLGASLLEDQDNAIEFNDALIEEQYTVVESFLDFSNTFATLDEADVQTEFDKTKDVAQQGLDNVKEVETIDGGEEFKDAMIELLEFYVRILDEDYQEIIDIYLKPASEYTDADLERLDEILIEVGAEETELDNKVQAAQEAFAEEFNIEIQENTELQNQIDNL